MKRILSFILISLAVNAQAQTMKEVLKTLPDSITPLLTQNNRLDLIDYIDANMKAEVKNKLGGTTTLTELNDSVAKIKLTSKSDLILRLVSKNGRKVLESTHIYRTDSLEHRKVKEISVE